MIELDGSQGEGGGQILRTSLALSVATGQPVAIEKIRAGRAKPGLMRQHLACVNAAAQISGAQVEGAELGSQSLRFVPGPVRAGDYRFAIASAGSCMARPDRPAHAGHFGSADAARAARRVGGHPHCPAHRCDLVLSLRVSGHVPDRPQARL